MTHMPVHGDPLHKQLWWILCQFPGCVLSHLAGDNTVTVTLNGQQTQKSLSYRSKPWKRAINDKRNRMHPRILCPLNGQLKTSELEPVWIVISSPAAFILFWCTLLAHANKCQMQHLMAQTCLIIKQLAPQCGQHTNRPWQDNVTGNLSKWIIHQAARQVLNKARPDLPLLECVGR